MKITRNTPADGNTRVIEIIVALKYLNNFSKTYKMPVINCEIKLILTWLSTCVITDFTGAGKFVINVMQNILF